MPLVKVEDTKGLYQTSGTGMQMVDSQVQPASETIRVAVINILCVDDSAGSLSGKYFDISSTTTNYRIWFDNDDGGATAPSAADPIYGPRTLVECKTQSDDDGKAAIAAELELLFESAGLTGVFDADDAAANGNICLFVRLPGAMAAPPDAGTSGFTLTYTDGSGQQALNPLKRVSVLEAPTVLGGNTVVAQDSGSHYTLAGGSFVGQEKLIVRNDTINIAQTVEIATINEDTGVGIDATATAVFPADTGTGTSASARFLDLIWIGDRWIQRSQGTDSTGTHRTITGIHSS